jgi:hypothetical protein
MTAGYVKSYRKKYESLDKKKLLDSIPVGSF